MKKAIAILRGIFKLSVGIHTVHRISLYVVRNRMQRTGMQNKVITTECDRLRREQQQRKRKTKSKVIILVAHTHTVAVRTREKCQK